jgi:hypothetical protein
VLKVHKVHRALLVLKARLALKGSTVCRVLLALKV